MMMSPTPTSAASSAAATVTPPPVPPVPTVIPSQPQSPLVVPPIVHAVGGSIGSTLSLLLLYPLERARIEMQASAVTISTSNRKASDASDNVKGNDDDNNNSHGSDDDSDGDGSFDCSTKNNVMNDNGQNIISRYSQSSIAREMEYFNEDVKLTSEDAVQSRENKEDNKGVREEDENEMEQQQQGIGQKRDLQSSTKEQINTYESSRQPSSPPPSISSDEFSFELLNSKTSESSKKSDTNNSSSKNSDGGNSSNGGTGYASSANSISQQPQIRGGTIEIQERSSPNTTRKPSFVPKGLANSIDTISATNKESSSPSLPSTPLFSTKALSSTNQDNNNLQDNTSQQDKQVQYIHNIDDDNDDNSNDQRKDGIIRTIQKLHKRRELYKGAAPVATTLAISNFIFFYALQATKKIIATGSTNNASLLASSIAGIVNVLITNPLWMANLRIIQSKEGEYDDDSNNDSSSSSSGERRSHNAFVINKRRKRMTLWKMLCHIVKNEGVKQLWNGTWASLILVCNPAIQYYVYERCKCEIISYRRKNSNFGSSSGRNVISNIGLRPMDAFILGAVAKAIATVLTYPLQLAQVLMRLQCTNAISNTAENITCEKDKKLNDNCDKEVDFNNDEDTGTSSNTTTTAYFSGTFDCMIQLYRQGGVKALYAGMDAKLVQTVLTSALTFLTYEQIVSMVAKSYLTFLSSSPTSNAQ